MTESMRKACALITKWRQAANEATVADAVVTYQDCAAELEAALGVHMLIAKCEGCGAEISMLSQNRRKQPDLPEGWSQWGTSKYQTAGGRRLAAWCPECREARRRHDLPSASARCTGSGLAAPERGTE